MLSGVFSSSETAFTAINRIRLKRQFEKDMPKQTETVERLLETPSRLITAILIGNNVSNVACSALGTIIINDILTSFDIHNMAIVVPIVTVVLTILLCVFAEITPKTLALKSPERLAVVASKFISPLTVVLYPFIVGFDMFHRFINRLFGIDDRLSNKNLSVDELKLMLDMGRDDGIIEDEKNKMLTNIFEFSDTIVREIMTPRTDAVCIADTETVTTVINLINHKGHSRIPVYEEKLDNIIGIIYAKDLLRMGWKDDNEKTVRSFMRSAVFIPEFQPVDTLLKEMKRSKLHMAIVVDEHGGMSGLVTLEDIIEEILGDIQDEYDPDEKKECIQIKPNVYDVDAKMNIRDLGSVMDIEFDDDEDFDTLGGLVLSLKGSFPSKDEVISFKNLKILVKEIKKRRIIRLEVTRHTVEETDP